MGEIDEQIEQGFCISFGANLRVVELDKANIAIQIRKFNKTKSEYFWTNYGYYGALHQALYKILGIKVRDGKVSTVQELTDRIEKVRSEILKATKNVKYGLR